MQYSECVDDVGERAASGSELAKTATLDEIVRSSGLEIRGCGALSTQNNAASSGAMIEAAKRTWNS